MGVPPLPDGRGSVLHHTTEPRESASGRVPLNKLCELEDFRNPEILAAIRALEPQCVRGNPEYPIGGEHRKGWEYAQLMIGARRLGAIHPQSFILSVAAGHEPPIFALTNYARLVFATDIYGTGEFAGRESAASMLVDPDAFALFPYNRNRLVVQYMNAMDLRYEAGTFDLVFALSSIEHFGGFDGSRRALQEMHRVCKPGGLVMFTTECVVNEVAPPPLMNPDLFSPALVDNLANSVPGLAPVEPIDFRISEFTRETVLNFDQVVQDLQFGRMVFPHIVLEAGGCQFTSVSVFLRKSE
jgi:SAM-dependent methyltransferase